MAQRPAHLKILGKWIMVNIMIGNVRTPVLLGGLFLRRTYRELLSVFEPYHDQAVAPLSHRPYYQVKIFRQSSLSGQPILKISTRISPDNPEIYTMQ
jgi:hypothetical protein